MYLFKFGFKCRYDLASLKELSSKAQSILVVLTQFWVTQFAGSTKAPI
jgi:hypothetical protein